ncbi:type IV pilus modification PilV family protein [Desulfonatronum parangueonense]
MMIKQFKDAKPQSGATLIELVISIVVISIALTGLMLTISLSLRHSSDAFVQIRAAELAQAYMDMLVSMEYNEDCVVPENSNYRDLFNSLKCFEDYDPKTNGWIIDITPWNVSSMLDQRYEAYSVHFQVTDTPQLYGTSGKWIYVNIVIPYRNDETISFSTFRAEF